MLLTIRNLPSVTRYSDVKNLIQTHCELSNVILDNLVMDGNNKKVTVGVADDMDANLIRRNLNGFVLAGSKLKVEEMRSNKGGSPQGQRQQSSSSKSTSRWAPPIPSLMDASTASGHNQSMGKNMPMMGQNMPMMGQHTSLMGFNPSIMGLNTQMINQNSLMMGQNSSMGQHSPMMDLSNSMMGQNMPMSIQNQSRMERNDSLRGHSNQNSSKMGQNSSMEQFSPFMGQINPQIGQNAPVIGNSLPPMVPPPLMGNASFSAPFYMTPQSNIYGTHTSGQQMASQSSNFSGQKGNMPLQNSEYPDTRNRKNLSDKSAWNSSADDSNYKNKRYSGNSERDRDRHDRGSASSSRRSKWDGSREERESEGTRYKSQSSPKRVVKPWANDNPPYNRNSEYGQFDRSLDREPDRYSRRQEQVPDFPGSNTYQNRMSSGGGRDSGSHHRRQSPPGFRRGPPRDDLRERGRVSPPAKRLKPNPPDYKYGPPQKKVNIPPKAQKISLKKIVERDLVWRSQAAAAIVLEMFKKIKTDDSVPQNVAHSKMKLAVRNRLLIILNNMIAVKISDQTVMYRRKFKPHEDQHLYDRIVRHIKRQIGRDNKNGSSEQDVAKPDKQPGKAVVKQPAKPVAKSQPAPKPQPKPNQPGELPKYPHGNKALHQIQKKNFKEEFKTSAPTSDLDDVTKKIVEEEMERIKELMLAECSDPADDAQQHFCDTIKKQTRILEEAKKMMTLNLAKRILKVGTVPLVRVIGTPKPPRKAPLVEFLKNKGVTSLKKSDRKALYIVTCESYDSFDNLCALNNVVIDDIKVAFKPMYLTAPLEKVRHKKGPKHYKTPGEHLEPNLEVDAWVDVPIDEEDIKDDADAPKSIKKEIVSPVKNKEVKPNKSETQCDSIKRDVGEQQVFKEQKGAEPVKDDYDFTKDVDEGSVVEKPAGDKVANDNENKQSKVKYVATEDADNDYPEPDDDAEFEVNEDDLEDY